MTIAPTVMLTSDPASISENGAVSTITATLSHKSSAITTITVRPVPGAYTVGATDSTIVIAAGQTANTADTVIITSVDNNRDAPPRNVAVTGVARNDQGAGSVTGGSLTLTDDDVAPAVTMVVSPASISENGGVSTVMRDAVSPVERGDDDRGFRDTPEFEQHRHRGGTRRLHGRRARRQRHTLTVAAGQTTSTGSVTITTVNNNRSLRVWLSKTVFTVTGTPSNSQGAGSVTDLRR